MRDWEQKGNPNQERRPFAAEPGWSVPKGGGGAGGENQPPPPTADFAGLITDDC